nr:PepSY-associated TM helix domain-containing protein [Streptomyces sp. RPA4-2]
MPTAPTLTTDGTPRPVAPTSARKAPLRPLILRLHFYAGVLVAPFLLVAAVTGLLYAASFQAEKIVYAHELTVPVGDRELPLSEQVAAARKAHPQGTVSAVRPSPTADATTRVLLSGVPGVDPDHTLAVFVDPYTAKVRGALEQYGATGALPLRTWIDGLHANLLLGETGRLYSELAASWLWVISGGGLVLWFGRRRARRKVRGTSGRRRTLGLHGTVGAWAAAGFFFLSATGLTWSTYGRAHRRAEDLPRAGDAVRVGGKPAASTRATAARGPAGASRPGPPTSTGSSGPPVPRASRTPSRSSRPRMPPPRTWCGRSSAAGPRNRTRSRWTRRPGRSPTCSGSPTTRCSPS